MQPESDARGSTGSTFSSCSSVSSSRATMNLLVGQRYRVHVDTVILRKSKMVHAADSEIVTEIPRGSAVQVLSYSLTRESKLRVKVVTEECTVGWCTLITEDDYQLLEIFPEEV